MNEPRPPYIIIVGNGRSGTNWLLDLFDLPEYTFIRNEPNEQSGAPLNAIGEAWIDRPSRPDLDLLWDDAVAWAASHMGSRDHESARPKVYWRPVARRVGLLKAVRRPRLRRWMSKVRPELRGGEWKPPSWLADRDALGAALPVLKMALVPGPTAWVLRSRPDVKVAHIVRHPGGFLNSWSNRYLAKQDRASVERANRARLRLVAEASPEYAGLMGEIDPMSAEESELWYWRYSTEVIDAAGASAPGYVPIVYERLTADTVSEIRRVYAACGVQWEARFEREVVARSRDSKGIARSWRDALDADRIELVERVLEGSRVAQWWDETGAAADPSARRAVTAEG